MQAGKHSDDEIAEMLAAAIADADSNGGDDALKRHVAIGRKVAKIVHLAMRKSGCGVKSDLDDAGDRFHSDQFRKKISGEIAWSFVYLFASRGNADNRKPDKPD